MWTTEKPTTYHRDLADGYRATIHRVADRVVTWDITAPGDKRFHSGTTVSHRDALLAVAAIATAIGLMDSDDNDVHMAQG